MEISLYDDQSEFIGEIRKLWKGHNKILGYAQTGFGKTRCAAKIIAGCNKAGMRVCFVVPRISLIGQTIKAFNELGLQDITLIHAEADTDHRAMITIASADTYIRREKGNFDLTIVDECHHRREKLLEWMKDHPDDRYLGLSATPFANWLGEYYTGLAKSKGLRWLIDNNRLAEYEIYAPTVPDLSGAKTSNSESHGEDYREKDLEVVMNGVQVVGNIVNNWLEHGENLPTMALCVNVAHANHITIEFNKAGVSCEVITAKTPIEERERIFKRVKNGITKVLASVNCLTEGFDEPTIQVLINARPTKSKARYLQGIGRVLRYLPGKVAKIFDHSGTSIALGYPEDIDIYSLATGNNGESKDSSRQIEEKTEKNPKPCPSCKFLKAAGVYICPKCGFKPIVGEDVEVDETRGLVKVKGKKKTYTTEEKQIWYSQLLGYQRERAAMGKPVSDGYIAHCYKDKFDVWPQGLSKNMCAPGIEVRNFIRHKNIKFSKKQAKA